jgi:hypothetical protein
VKILYAAGNRPGSRLQYDRFLQSMRGKNIELKTAAFQQSLGDLNCDYTLDALLNFYHTEKDITYNGNYQYYCKQIQTFAPDLIISDMELLTSIIALELHIQLWQVSSLLMYWAMPDEIKKQMDIFWSNAYIFYFGSDKTKQKMSYVINNSDKRFVISHLCDTEYAGNIKPGFEWIRPEFQLNDDMSKTPAISNGHETITADLFYNQRPLSFSVDKSDPEAVTLSELEMFYGRQKPIGIKINDSVQFLMEKF